MKLIRDHIPADMRSRGYEPELVFVKGESLRLQLLTKLMEESREVIDSNGEDVGELGDVFEVLSSLSELLVQENKFSEDFVRHAIAKRSILGGFMNGTVWVNSDDPSPEANAARAGYAEAQKERP